MNLHTTGCPKEMSLILKLSIQTVNTLMTEMLVFPVSHRPLCDLFTLIFSGLRMGKVFKSNT